MLKVASTKPTRRRARVFAVVVALGALACAGTAVADQRVLTVAGAACSGTPVAAIAPNQKSDQEVVIDGSMSTASSLLRGEYRQVALSIVARAAAAESAVRVVMFGASGVGASVLFAGSFAPTSTVMVYNLAQANRLKCLADSAISSALTAKSSQRGTDVAGATAAAIAAGRSAVRRGGSISVTVLTDGCQAPAASGPNRKLDRPMREAHARGKPGADSVGHPGRVLARECARRELGDEGSRRRALRHGRVQRTGKTHPRFLAARLPASQGIGMRDRKRGAVMGRPTAGLVRLTADQAWAQIKSWAAAIGTIVDGDGRPIEDPVQIPVQARKPIPAASVAAPVSSSAKLGEIRSEGAATAAAISFAHVDPRAEAKAKRGASQARLARLRRRRQTNEQEITTTETERAAVIADLPGRLRRRIGQRPSRVARATPWAMFGADVSLMANPYGIFGPIALPFPASTYVGNTTQLLRAVFVAFGFTFGLKMVGAKCRDLSEELRERWLAAGMAADALVIGVIVVSAALLATAAARLQAAFLAIATGGTTVTVPASTLLAIVVFLGAVSFASGFFGNEPELERIAAFDAQLSCLRHERETVDDLVALELGKLRELRAQERAVDDRERLDLDEQARHTDRNAYAHLGTDTSMYGVEFDADEACVPGATP